MKRPRALSDETGSLGPRVESLVCEYADLWREETPDPEEKEWIYSGGERRSFEKEFSKLAGEISSAAETHAHPECEPDADGLNRFADRLRPLFGRLLGELDLPLETVYDARFVESTRSFITEVRSFDPDLGISEVYQALRNVWIMNSLQFVLGRQVEHTDAIFGYSMIYPYLDNLLDDPRTSPAVKAATVAKIKGWLEGLNPSPETPVEDKIRRLVARVENMFDRKDDPDIFRSMLAIFNAQVRSLSQQHNGFSPGRADILEISMEKGGTSVLADGYLTAGRLDPAEEDFCFGFGTFLQLADDLQDVSEDIRSGHRTLFTVAAGQGVLDGLVLKLQGYIRSVLRRNSGLHADRMEFLAALIRRSCFLMNIGSAGRSPEYFSRGFLRACQARFPVRFSYLRKAGRTLPQSLLNGRRKIRDVDPALAAFLTVSSRTLSLS
jgi:hypothetical protein